eukprot:scaffold43257_cov50-Phaeocystis_antarctica.AAC.2
MRRGARRCGTCDLNVWSSDGRPPSVRRPGYLSWARERVLVSCVWGGGEQCGDVWQVAGCENVQRDSRNQHMNIITGCVRAEHAYSGTSCGSLTLEVGKSPTEVRPADGTCP